MNILFLILLITIGGQNQKKIKHPDCIGVNRWPTSMAYAELKNEGIVSSETIDFTKTQTIRIASEQIGNDLYHQVHLVTFTKINSEIIQVLTVSDASSEECSLGAVDVYVISKKLRK